MDQRGGREVWSKSCSIDMARLEEFQGQVVPLKSQTEGLHVLVVSDINICMGKVWTHQIKGSPHHTVAITKCLKSPQSLLPLEDTKKCGVSHKAQKYQPRPSPIFVCRQALVTQLCIVARVSGKPTPGRGLGPGLMLGNSGQCCVRGEAGGVEGGS